MIVHDFIKPTIMVYDTFEQAIEQADARAKTDLDEIDMGEGYITIYEKEIQVCKRYWWQK